VTTTDKSKNKLTATRSSEDSSAISDHYENILLKTINSKMQRNYSGIELVIDHFYSYFDLAEY